VQSSNQIVTSNKPTPSFLQATCPSCCLTNSVKAQKGKIPYEYIKILPYKRCGLGPPHYAPPDLLTLKVVSTSRVTWATSVPILVFLGLSVLDLGPMYVTDIRQTDRRASSLNAPYP